MILGIRRARLANQHGDSFTHGAEGGFIGKIVAKEDGKITRHKRLGEEIGDGGSFVANGIWHDLDVPQILEQLQVAVKRDEETSNGATSFIARSDGNIAKMNGKADALGLDPQPRKNGEFIGEHDVSAIEIDFFGRRKRDAGVALPTIQAEIAKVAIRNEMLQFVAAATADYRKRNLTATGEPLQSAASGRVELHQFRARRERNESAIEIEENGNVMAIANARRYCVPISKEMWEFTPLGFHWACATSVRSCVSMRISVRSESTLAAQR